MGDIDKLSITSTFSYMLRPLLRASRPTIQASRFSKVQLTPLRKMSGIKIVTTKEACPVAGPYSQAIIAGPNVYVSGQIPADKTGALISGSITDKTTQCCENILAILKEASTPVDKIVKVNVFLDDMAHFAEMNGVFEKYFAHKPARSCVAVKQLPKGVPVEIECIAYNGKGGS